MEDTSVKNRNKNGRSAGDSGQGGKKRICMGILAHV